MFSYSSAPTKSKETYLNLWHVNKMRVAPLLLNVSCDWAIHSTQLCFWHAHSLLRIVMQTGVQEASYYMLFAKKSIKCAPSVFISTVKEIFVHFWTSCDLRQWDNRWNLSHSPSLWMGHEVRCPEKNGMETKASPVRRAWIIPLRQSQTMAAISVCVWCATPPNSIIPWLD